MNFFLCAVIMLLNMQNKNTINFEKNELSWVCINDGVMGGISKSSFSIKDGIGIFNGKVSLDNNGGFASVRTAISEDYFKNTTGIILRVKGDGKTYKFRIRTNDNFDGVAYSTSFKTEGNGLWEEIIIPYTNFKASYRGYTINDAPPINPNNIRQIGFLIGNKKQENFLLRIDWIKTNHKR